jgi:hypothetical protein
MGRLIPAGTGLPVYKKLGIQVQGEEEERKLPQKNLDMEAAN